MNPSPVGKDRCFATLNEASPILTQSWAEVTNFSAGCLWRSLRRPGFDLNHSWRESNLELPYRQPQAPGDWVNGYYNVLE